VRKRIMSDWEAQDCCYKLVIESEVYWRLGAPPPKPEGGTSR
jgi:hypothetical protein